MINCPDISQQLTFLSLLHIVGLCRTLIAVIMGFVFPFESYFYGLVSVVYVMIKFTVMVNFRDNAPCRNFFLKVFHSRVMTQFVEIPLV